MQLTHKIELVPTCKQASYFVRACGTARFVWNWALAEWNKQYEAGGKPKANDLKKQFNAVKYELFPWLKGIHRDAHSQPFAYLNDAFQRFFKKQANRPNFKKKGKSKDSFYVANDQFRTNEFRVRLPLIGWVKMTEELRFTGKVMRAVVSRTADRWFIAISVDVGEYKKDRKSSGTVGVDLGINSAATVSDGTKFQAPKPLKNIMRRLKIASRMHSRKVNGSKNKARASLILAKIQMRLANIRKDFWHKLTTRLVSENQAIGIEDLNVAGMMKTNLSRSVADVAIGMFRPMLTYKAEIYETKVVVADRYYPSSKTCSSCGVVNKELKRSDTSWSCDCGATHDRDDNASMNLANVALRSA